MRSVSSCAARSASSRDSAAAPRSSRKARLHSVAPAFEHGDVGKSFKRIRGGAKLGAAGIVVRIDARQRPGIGGEPLGDAGLPPLRLGKARRGDWSSALRASSDARRARLSARSASARDGCRREAPEVAERLLPRFAPLQLRATRRDGSAVPAAPPRRRPSPASTRNPSQRHSPPSRVTSRWPSSEAAVQFARRPPPRPCRSGGAGGQGAPARGRSRRAVPRPRAAARRLRRTGSAPRRRARRNRATRRGRRRARRPAPFRSRPSPRRNRSAARNGRSVSASSSFGSVRASASSAPKPALRRFVGARASRSLPRAAASAASASSASFSRSTSRPRLRRRRCEPRLRSASPPCSASIRSRCCEHGLPLVLEPPQLRLRLAHGALARGALGGGGGQRPGDGGEFGLARGHRGGGVLRRRGALPRYAPPLPSVSRRSRASSSSSRALAAAAASLPISISC